MSWSGIKKQVNRAEIEAWCDEMGIENYTINSKGEIDVSGDGGVWLNNKDFEELPYKFGTINGYFSLSECKNLTSLKNCPDYVGDYFSCSGCIKLDSLKGCPSYVGDYFSCSGCIKLDSLKGCPSYVVWNFYCSECKRKFTKKEVKSLCKVKGNIYTT